MTRHISLPTSHRAANFTRYYVIFLFYVSICKKIKGDDLGQTHLIVFSTTSVRHRGFLLSLVVISIVCF